MSVLFILVLISSMSHVDFKKYLCCPVDFKGQGPLGSKLTDVVSMVAQTSKVKSGTAVKGYYSGVRGVMSHYNGVRSGIVGVIVE